MRRKLAAGILPRCTAPASRRGGARGRRESRTGGARRACIGLAALALLLLAAPPVHASCPSTATAVSMSLGAAEAAFAAMDDGALAAAVAQAEADAGCLGERPAPSVIARLHRAEGLRAFVAGDMEGAQRAFAAARALEPDYSFPPDLIPAGHPLLAAYTALPPAPADTTTLAAPAAGHLELDGQTGVHRPEDRPVLVQLLDRQDVVQASTYLKPGEALFDYALASPPAARAPSPRGPTRPLAVASGVALLGAGVLYGLAYDAHSDYDALPDRAPGLEAARNRTNGLFAGSVAAGTVALGTGLGAVVTGVW